MEEWCVFLGEGWGTGSGGIGDPQNLGEKNNNNNTYSY